MQGVLGGVQQPWFPSGTDPGALPCSERGEKEAGSNPEADIPLFDFLLRVFQVFPVMAAVCVEGQSTEKATALWFSTSAFLLSMNILSTSSSPVACRGVK